MNHLHRRRFLKAAAVGAAAVSLPAASWARVMGANDTIRVGVIGLRGRGGDHIQGFSALPGVKVTAVCDCDAQVLGSVAERLRKQERRRPGLRRRAQAAGRQGRGRHLDGDAQPLACADGRVGLPGGQGCVCGEAGLPQRLGRTPGGQGRPQVQPHRPDGHAEPLVAHGRGRGGRVGEERAISARSPSPAACATIAATASARRTAPSPSRRISTTTCGAARRRKTRCCASSSTTTGTGSGRPATATSATRASTRWTSRRWFLGEQELSPRVWSVGGRFGYVDDGTTPNTQIVFHDYAQGPAAV